MNELWELGKPKLKYDKKENDDNAKCGNVLLNIKL